MKRQSKLTKHAVLCAMTAFILLSASFSPVPPSMVVVIDAGHGGTDPGNLGTGRFGATEKNVTLDVALLLRDYISERFPDVKIVMTRTGDSYPTLKQRVAIANDAQADLFMSIHCDAFTKPTAIGSSTFVMGMHKSEESLRVAMQENASIYREEDYKTRYAGFDPKDPDTFIALSLKQSVYLSQSLELGSLIQNQFKDRVGRTDRGVRQAGYYVISFTQMPSVLVELGFLTNPSEEEFLNSAEGKELMASALLRAFRSYKEIHHPGPNTQESGLTNKEDKEVKPSETNSPTQADRLPSPTYRVQFLASRDALSTDDSRLEGLTDVVEYLRNGFYKYAVGTFQSSVDASTFKSEIHQRGFTDAFVVKFEGETWDEQGVKPLLKN
ncbi:MAG: N-acetylmuramoyl-L-alanine amidase [Bacteroidetes bacterium]|nr:N-acetylmuramoyl-L-alanine amidase [Bacteroidota bacterium]MDA1335804.1 N-acetylmuramoyl-L-alanine amidase [Bacteroidota bacterium]